MKISYLISLIIISGSLMFFIRFETGSNVIVIEKRLDQFPRTIGKYRSVDIPMESNVVRILDTDVFIFRNYISPGEETITLYIGYYGTKKGGRSDHGPRGCYPGAGWAISKEEKVELDITGLDNIPGRVVLNRIEVSKAGKYEIVYHWYQANRNKIISSGLQLNLNRFISRLRYNRNDGAFIRVSSEVNGDPQKVVEKLERFIRDIYPMIIEYWPNEKDV